MQPTCKRAAASVLAKVMSKANIRLPMSEVRTMELMREPRAAKTAMYLRSWLPTVSYARVVCSEEGGRQGAGVRGGRHRWSVLGSLGTDGRGGAGALPSPPG
jgi:hypothetical protein